MKRKPPTWSGTWQDDAACRGTPTDLFFPNYLRAIGHRGARPPARLQALCDSCPVRVPCLTWALRNNEVGIWGGTTESQRAAILKAVARVKCPGCRAGMVFNYGRIGICLACGLSWRQPRSNPEADERTSKPATIGAHFPR